MILYPTIELKDGRPVSLYRGRLDEPQVWHVDPVAKAREFAAAGASWMHLTDFDALSGDPRNTDLVTEVIHAAGIPVQLAGGFRTRDRVEAWINRGAGRIVVGTLAVQDPDLVKELAKRHPDQIVLSVDVYHGRLMVEGWREPSVMEPATFIEAFAGAPLAGIVVTDIGADAEETDGTLGMITGLAARTRTPVIASGLVRALDDIARLKYVPNIAGALVGRALFNKSVDLDAALALAAEAPEPTAAFR